MEKHPQLPSYGWEVATCAMMLPDYIDEWIVIIVIHL